ncbi:putative NADH:flavin oxidoreductase/NADH oxidase [Cupriavidus taiwanensis]|uniref:NADH:flavin oxidoreductase/NADH oxidase n=1 Tax=Cupriavidus taiwanensis TaxID=164546 RepID=A0A375EDC3_9BURK|nr:NADH:flavin oxidoreductase [Cupriavidus taiwanensis]SOZ69919.1 putative NADH:flavin oxidoreductase/NADH oxidase [Cupriavidus taiwanensis]SOZ71057.1 putative NADH:flavin oxidoreductase/NADH oxidase [Cupriavidus taiwanensis]SOZ73719.1 putative NADH:flavin oxidoreductase/NADH oxidase [Cupriavidus taiwanensis]SPA03157.1 putative NADH:flavin oxidoreductase/NADH oxidase [Cupriavidus taiwanensis]SPA10531.1 putative NADH:flavin oxidoreductase/NADH oxidase [Cupriavidus taiwanensis]
MPQLQTSAAPAFTPLRLGPLTLRNRFIKAGANEGMTPHGLPTRALVRHHRDLAAGGVGMTTVAYAAVADDGLTFAHQLSMRAEQVPHLRVLTDAVHREGAAACLQITHAGSFTTMRHGGSRAPGTASSGLNAFGMMHGVYFQRAMRAPDMERVAGQFAAAARLARDAGFDAVEIHMGHGYLLNQFLSPLSNRRRDAFGGSVENRTRFPAAVLRQVKEAVGADLAVCCKLSVSDGVPGGNQPADSALTARLLEAEGADLLTLSGGRNVESPWALFGSPMPTAQMKAAAPTALARLGITMLERRTPRDLAFRELYFLEASRVVRQAVRMPLAYVGGVKSLDNVAQLMGEGFDAIALARALIHDPALVAGWRDGALQRSACDSCNGCVARIYDPAGVSCVHGPGNDPALTRTVALQ